MLDASALANILHNVIPQKVDGQGKPTSVSGQTQAYAEGIVAALKAAIFSNLPATINGVTAPGAPLASGVGVGGVIVMTPAPMLAKTANGFKPPTPQLIAENTAIIAYIATGLVNFAPGSITGTCTNSPVNPGPLVSGAGSNGMIVGLTGVAALAAVTAALGMVGPNGLSHYNALINYVSANAIGAYAANSVQGVCPPGGGPLAGGFAAGGTFT